MIECRDALLETTPFRPAATPRISVQRCLHPRHPASAARKIGPLQRIGRGLHLDRCVFDPVQLIPDGRREQILVELPRGARAPFVTLVRLTLAPVNAKRVRALVITDGEQERGPLARRARRLPADLGDSGGDAVELRAFFGISTIFVKTRK